RLPAKTGSREGSPYSLSLPCTSDRLAEEAMRWPNRPSAQGRSRRLDLMENVQGELSAHVITVSEFSGKKITWTIECVGHEHQNLGIVNTPGADQWGHFVLPFFKSRGPIGCL